MRTAVKIFQACFRPIQRLPLGFHYACCGALAWAAGHLLHYRRDVVMVNLARSFPEKKWKEIRKIAEEFYKHLGDIAAEALWFGGSYKNPSRLRKAGLCSFANPEPFIETIHSGRSIVLLSSHLGNWELFGGQMQYFPENMDFTADKFVVVYKELKNRFWDEFLGANRTAILKDYHGYVETKQMLRFALSNKDKGYVYVFPTDQYPYKGTTKHEIPEFLHQRTQVIAGGAVLAHKLHLPVFFYCMCREARGRYKIYHHEICQDASTMTPEEIMTRYCRLLETAINADPSNYLWSHNRWK